MGFSTGAPRSTAHQGEIFLYRDLLATYFHRGRIRPRPLSPIKAARGECEEGNFSMKTKMEIKITDETVRLGADVLSRDPFAEIPAPVAEDTDAEDFGRGLVSTSS